MPYKVGKHASCPANKPFAVVKEDTGALVACHPSRSRANTQMRALYANEGKSMGDEQEVEEKAEDVEKDCYDNPYSWRPFGGATSFEELDAMAEAQALASYQEDLGWKLRSLMQNILSDPEIDDKQSAMIGVVNEYSDLVKKPPSKMKGLFDKMKSAMGFGEEDNPYELVDKAAIKRENGMDFPMRDYAFTPDPASPATWKLRLTESPGKITSAQLGRAAAALSSGGFRGQKAQIPPAALAAVKRRIRAEYRKLGVQESAIPASVKSLPEETTESDNPFYIWKDQSSGNYQFVAIYSNNYRDDDHPAEILSEKAHHGFAKALELGIFDPPELWHWHLPGTRWGVAKSVMVVDGFAVALGEIDPGHEAEAEAAMKSKEPLAMSHGMPRAYIVRNDDDPTVIDFYASKEISVLPRWAAANKLTGFVIIDSKESNMPLTADQKEHLTSMNVPAAVIAGLDGLGELGKQSGRESKEATPAAEATNDAAAASESKAQSDFATKQEVAATLGELFQPLVEAIKQQNDLIVAQGEAIAALQAESKELRTLGKQGLAAAVDLTPSASLSDMTRNSIFAGNSAAKLADNDPLKGKKSEESEEKQNYTGVPFLDGLIQRTYQGGQ